MDFEMRQSGDVQIIKLKGDIMGGPDATGLTEKLHEVLQKGVKKILVDLEKVQSMNSSGLGILIGAVTTVRNQDGDLKLLHVSPKPAQLLKITHLDCVFETFDNEDTAIASF